MTDDPYQDLPEAWTGLNFGESVPSRLTVNMPPSHVMQKAQVTSALNDNNNAESTTPSKPDCKCHHYNHDNSNSNYDATSAVNNLLSVGVTEQPPHGNTPNPALQASIEQWNQSLAVEPWIRYNNDATNEPPIQTVPTITQ